MWYYFALLVVLIIALAVLTRVREGFINMQDPQELFAHARKLLDKYDTKEIWDHMANIKGKDPRQLALLNLASK
jgi:hypothetical protein